MTTPIINFNEVSFSFKQKEIFKDLNLSIEQGEILWIKGDNGQGKTTLLRLILNFHSPIKGDLFLNPGLKIGWAPSVDNSFFPRLTGKENLDFFYELSDPKEKFNLKINSNVTEEILKTPFYKMSSGMKQLLILLRSLLLNPDLVLWDEPFRSLDLKHQEIVHSLISAMHQEKKTIIFTTHLDYEFNNLPVRKLCIKENNLV